MVEVNGNASKPFSQACENNKQVILDVLRQFFESPGWVLEVGSGSGQHSVYMAENLSHLEWQCSDRVQNHVGILAWGEEAKLPNWHPPIDLDVADEWLAGSYDYVFSANTAHIMSWPEVLLFLAGVNRVLRAGGRFCLYGPFNYGGEYTSPSNARFDEWLKEQNPQSAIRHFEDLQREAESMGWSLVADLSMPANNRCLIWEKAS